MRLNGTAQRTRRRSHYHVGCSTTTNSRYFSTPIKKNHGEEELAVGCLR